MKVCALRLTDDKCTTPLLSAVRHNHADVCQLLLAANCDTDVAGEVTINDDYVTVTPLRCAVLLSHWQCAQLLICAGE
jgi:ankyrin repeat protein